MTNEARQHWLIECEKLKNMMGACAEGGPRDLDEYTEIRMRALQEPEIAARLPRCVKSCSNGREFWAFIKSIYAHYSERSEFLRTQFEPLLAFLDASLEAPADSSLSKELSKVDSYHVQRAWEKALERRATDPDGAITCARTLLETVFKHILDERGVGYGANPDLPKLYGLVSKELQIAPSQQTDLILRQIAGGCCSVVEGVGALRNKLGDSHGKAKAASATDARYSHLAVNLAGALAVFVVETWEESK